MAYQQHHAQSQSIIARCVVITLSDTRTPETDTSGQRIGELLAAEAHVIVESRLIPDEQQQLADLLATLLARDDIDAILTNGGTGISRRDQTINAIEAAIQIPLPGFGELFRMLSWEQIGPGAMLSRAAAGIASGKLIFAMPGSTKAVELAMTRLILPEIRHLIWELRK
jgi:molybdenum cofactor biosynthesis protein B